MTLAFWYWLFMVLWLIFGAWMAMPPRSDVGWRWGLIPFILFVIIGLKLFGSPIQG
jgi:hypothetical protein